MSFLGKWKVGGSGSNNPTAGPSTPLPRVPLPADLKRFGLENFGNTCYANSILQSLYYCAPFREFVLASRDPSYPPNAVAWLHAQLQQAQPPTPAPSSPTPVPVTKSTSSRGTKRPPSSADLRTTPAAAAATAATADTPGIPSAPPTLFSALRALFLYIAYNPEDKGTVSPLAFVQKVRKENEIFYSPQQHQDAHEFMNFLLNKVVEDIESIEREQSREDLSRSITSSASSAGSHAKTFVHTLFEGVLTSETRCLTCENVSSRDESFLDLSIDIEQNSSVTACLRSFSASETLCQRNKFFCDACCGLQEAEKRMKIKKLPNVLALHLKRFKQEDSGKYVKLAYRVAFPFELRLFNTVDDAEDPDRLYELFAIVVHIGAGPHHGHYISIIKSRGTWLQFDDNTVEPIKESEISKYFGESNSGSGYVLFYQAVDLDRARLGLSPKDALLPVPSPVIPPVNGHALTESPEVKVSVLPPTDPTPPVSPQADAPSTTEKPTKPRLDIPGSPPVPDPPSFSARSSATVTPAESATKSPGLWPRRKASYKATSTTPQLGNGEAQHYQATSGDEQQQQPRDEKGSGKPWYKRSMRDKSRKRHESASASDAPALPPRTPTHATFASDSDAGASSPIPIPPSPNLPMAFAMPRDSQDVPIATPPSAFHRRPSADVRRGSLDTLGSATGTGTGAGYSAFSGSHHPAGSFSTLGTSTSRPTSRPPSSHAPSSRPTSAGYGSPPHPPPPLSPPPPLTELVRTRKNSAKNGFRKIVESVTQSSSSSASAAALSDSESAGKRVRNRLSSNAFSPPPRDFATTPPPPPPLPLSGDQFGVPDIGASPPKPQAKSPGRKMSLSGGLRVLARGKDKDKDRGPPPVWG